MAPASDKEIREMRDAEKLHEIRDVLRIISDRMVMPLYLLFWLCDIVYTREHMWLFLAIRASVVPACLLIRYYSKRASTFAQVQLLGLAYTFGMAATINAMIFVVGDRSSAYYAGLNLVAVGSLAFIPWSATFYAITVAAIYVPYYFISAFAPGSLSSLAVNSFFIVSTIMISLFIRIFNEAVRRKEVRSRLNLKNEIEQRDRVIEEKTLEGVKLASLSRQFSPQVVDAIKSGKINLLVGIHRTQICAIFIDIVNSTERVARGDKDKIHRVISMFMEDTIKTLLKYDITVDKFLGDGILAFSNDPVPYSDYVDRVVQAANEIKKRIHARQDIYENFWMNELEIRIGIASGFANVGFYGNDKFYKSYTAIGPVINLASRLCSAAEPNQVLVNLDAMEQIRDKEKFKFEFAGKKSLKGFEMDVIKVYSVVSADQQGDGFQQELDCPACPEGLMFLDTDPHGIMVLKCRECGHIHGSPVTLPKAA